MEYVDGEPLDKYAGHCSGRDFLSVLMQIVDGLGHLHALGYYHMDVKEENIIIQIPLGAGPNAILLDLGGSKKVKQIGGEQLRDRTVYISTDKATRPERRGQLGYYISRSQLAGWGPDLDFYAFGAMVERLLRKKDLSEKVEEDLSASGAIALSWVIKRLTEGESDDPITKRHYKAVRQLQADLSRLLPEYTWPLSLPELSQVPGSISLGLPREYIGLTSELMELVNHPLFQRLRNIPQLEYVSLIYPGATHSRFHHSLSAFQLARTFISRLLEYPEFRMLAGPEYIQAALVLALIHDIGHYPLSHAFEDFAEYEKGRDRGSEWQIQSEETLFKSFICPEPNDPVNIMIKNSLKQICLEKKLTTLGETIREMFPKSYNLIAKIMYPERDDDPSLLLLHSIIDSAIDVDKVSYLTDDSDLTGVRFGKGIDIHGLVQALIPPKGMDNRRGAIAITENGLAAAESIVLSRFWMISRVYWHRTNRATQTMHKFVIADLIESGHFDFLGYLEETLFSTQSQATDLLAKRYEDTHAEFGNRTQQETRNPLVGLLNSNRDIYKRFLSISNGPGEADHMLYERVLEEGPLGVVSIGERVREHLASRFNDFEWRYGDVLVDIPHRRRDLLGYNVLVYLDRDPENGRNLSGGENPVSPLLRGLPENFEYNVKKCRIFIQPAAMEMIRSSSTIDELRNSTRRHLEDYYKVPSSLPR